MEHRFTYVRYASTIVNGPYATASSTNKRTSINMLFNNTITVLPSPPKLRAGVLLRSMRSASTMPSTPYLLLQLLTPSRLDTFRILKIHPSLQTLILRGMTTRHHPSLPVGSIGVYIRLRKILKFRSRLSKKPLHMWPKPPFVSWMET